MKLYILSCLSCLIITDNCQITTFWVHTTAPYEEYFFDFCDIVDCRGTEDIRWDPSYQYKGEAQFYICVTRPGNENCNSWSDVGWSRETIPVYPLTSLMPKLPWGCLKKISAKRLSP
ncbi:hypothetical protein GDO81_028776 [Engystomops pustulosus]|uniref:Uncharacterized protein n=1 Tax=Engystomops pustulosus TaxID=76066 RepID=A0AAV6YCR8_ENGPU|nr:hypothetical protein GDO81_028776 [Engystomops pustulosus]